VAITEKRKTYLAAWRAKNRDSVSAANKRYRVKNRDQINFTARQKNSERAAYQKKYQANNSERLKEYHRRYYQENREKLLTCSKEQHRKNPIAARVRAKKWKQQNPERSKKLARKYWDKNKDSERTRLKALETPEQKRENLARYRARKNNAMPVWLTSEDRSKIRAIYKGAARRGLEVDHIIPIRNKIVCGLHVPWNLQLLSPTENKMKSNRLPTVHECIATVSVSA